MWNLARAIMLARERIYIHDWWLSPGELFSSSFFFDFRLKLLGFVELQMRRPGMEKYRLDRLLQRKAREGVKVFIIL